MAFNEDSRVKIPSLIHLTRLGYEYRSLKSESWDEKTNIFPQIFLESLMRINPALSADDARRQLDELSLTLDNEDLGQAFYEKITTRSGIRSIDFENFGNNSFNVVTELTYKNGDEEFRPDIIVLINGIPLAFIEVKKPNNLDGIKAERDRINRRSQNKKFHRFMNITQLMVFSNNMEYDDTELDPIQGAFYTAASYKEPVFNYFREEEKLDLAQLLAPEEDEVENFILKDTNHPIIKHNPEFLTNKNPNSPTNRILTSLFSKERLKFILLYALAYVRESDGLEKHVMRYPQLFATKAISSKLDAGIRKGIIWHTQGSGKTALTYYNVKHLTNYFQQKSIIPKFYFIVDRLDLAEQAKREFTARGLVVKMVDSKAEFATEIRRTTAIHNHSGRPEITVVNIQKFENDPNVVTRRDYDINIQRVYFLDEVHRSYNPKGSFLSNLNESDVNAIKIGLTGTPLLGDDYNSKVLFGDYIHKYYYNASIADGYTLRLIREEIATEYKIVLQKVLDELEILKGEAEKKIIYAHPNFAEPMLDYIIEDFETSRLRFNDATIGGMVVCHSSDQAKELYRIFQEKYSFAQAEPEQADEAAEPPHSYKAKRKKDRKVKTAALILHDVGTKEERKQMVEDFKDGRIDFLFVFNMLLTGFDAKRLKKLYLGRVIKDHNLLQTLTRVNRRYKKFKYGYVVDFADIRREFDKTNKAYFDELQSELGDEFQHYSNLFKSKEEIEDEMVEIKDFLFQFDTANKEVFSQQISQISDIGQMQQIVKVLNNTRDLYNLIRLLGHYDMLGKIDFTALNDLRKEANNHLALLHQKAALENENNTDDLLNVALEDVVFLFKKIGEEELLIADQLKDTLRRTREDLASNFDKKDPEFITLKEELERLFRKQNMSEISQDEMKANIDSLRKIHEKIKELNRLNNQLKHKYQSDEKYARIHKRLRERKDIEAKESIIFDALQQVKAGADETVLFNQGILSHQSYFEQLMTKLVINQFVKEQKIKLNAETSKFIGALAVREYLDEFNGASA